MQLFRSQTQVYQAVANRYQANYREGKIVKEGLAQIIRNQEGKSPKQKRPSHVCIRANRSLQEKNIKGFQPSLISLTFTKYFWHPNENRNDAKAASLSDTSCQFHRKTDRKV